MALHLYGLSAVMQSNQLLFNNENNCKDLLPSAVHDVKVLQNEFSAEQQIISYHILHLLPMKKKCQNVTLKVASDLIRDKT